MKKIILFLAATFIFLQINSTAFAQYDKTKVNKKAMAAYTEAQQKMGLMQTTFAKDYLHKAITADPNFCDALILLGDIYYSEKNYDQAVTQYQKAIAIDDVYCGKKYRSIATILASEKKYDEAIVNINKFLLLEKINNGEKIIATHELDSYEFIKDAIQHPVPFVYQNMGDSINSHWRDYSPAITADGQTLIFNRQLGNGANANEDLFISKKINGAWSWAVPLSNNINTADNNEGAECLSVDGNYMFYTICGNKKYMSSSCDIYLSKRNGDGWSAPNPLDQNINTGDMETQPSFSADGNYLYFAAHRKEENFGQLDIYVSTLTNKGWSKPVNLGANINTSMDEESPFIHPDGKTLYFSSNGHPGMGKMDLYMSKKQADGTWGEAVNLGYPINTEEVETNLAVAADGKTAFYASAMGKGGNDLDLYTFELNPEVRADVVTYMKGITYDAKTGKPVQAILDLIDLATGKTIIEAASDATSGNYLICIPAGKNYALNVSNPNYLFYSENFSLKDHPSDKTYTKDVGLNKMEVGQSVVLKNVFFETDKFDLKPESKIELDKLITLMKQNPTLKVQIGGHTDNSGSAQKNQALSTNRAKAVFEYMSSKISPERLSYKGFADTKPIATNDTEEGKAQNRRTEFVVTEK